MESTMPEQTESKAMPKKTSRRRAREAAFLLLFAAGFADQPDDAEQKEAGAALTEELLETPYDAYTDELVKGVGEKEAELDEIYVPFLTGSWRKERLSHVTRTLLRMAVYELYYVADMADQAGVVINESVELCKRYAGEGKEPGFLNGVLGSVVRSRRK